MQLKKNNTIVYSGRILSDSELLNYQQKYNNNLDIVLSTEEVIECRKKAYKAESDPLYMEWQFDQTPDSEKAWRDKVSDIKARYPLPSKS